MDKIKRMYKEHKEEILYLFFGMLTVLINLISYHICEHILSFGIVLSTIIAWIIAVIFAFITNKIWVFESKEWKKSIVLGEVSSFFTCRIFTGILDVFIMFVFAKKLRFNDMIIKSISNIVVIILNYVASKLVVFKKK